MFMHKKFCRHVGLRPYFKCPTTSIKGHGGGKKGKALLVYGELKAMAPLPLIFLSISIDGSAIFWGFFGDFLAFSGGFCGQLVNGEGHGAIALDLLAHISRR